MSVAADELFRVASAISYTVNQFEDEFDNRSKPKAEFSPDGYEHSQTY